MGSKSSSAPAPDPRLVDAQIKSMGIQDDAIGRVLKNSEDMMPLQRESMQFGLDSARKAYDQSQEDRSWMLTRRGALSGIQDRMVSDAATFNSDDRMHQMLGEADSDVDEAFSSARGQGMRGLQRIGVNPNSGRSLALNSQVDVQHALAKATTANKVRAAARAEGFALTDRAHNALAGYPAMSAATTGAGAGFGATGLTLTNQGLAGMNSGYGQAGQMAGQMGSNASGMYGAMGSYKNGQDQVASSNNPLGTIVGAVTGAGTGWGLTKLFGK